MNRLSALCWKCYFALNRKGEGYVETGIKLLISVVVGSLLLAGLYALFNDVILPAIGTRITDMFNYGG